LPLHKLAGGDHRLFASIAGESRPFRVHVPKDVDHNLLPVLAFDGITICNQLGSMGGINGLDDAAERHRFIVVYPVPKTRLFGILAGWNSPGTCLACRAGYDDVAFVRAILDMLDVEGAYAIGFSAGAQFSHILAGTLPGRIAGVVSVSGTWLGLEPQPAKGTAALIIHGENDPVQPYHGGNPPPRVRILAALGNRNILLSRPDRQVEAYAAANDYREPPIVETTDVYVKRSFGSDPVVPVVEYVIRSPHGGHTYHGRKTGKGTESFLSSKHGRPLAPDVFSVNDLFPAIFWEARRNAGSGSLAGPSEQDIA